MNGFIEIIKSLKDLGVSIDGVTETTKNWIKKQEGRFLCALLAPLNASLVQPVICSVVKGISGRRLEEQEDVENPYLCSII